MRRQDHRQEEHSREAQRRQERSHGTQHDELWAHDEEQAHDESPLRTYGREVRREIDVEATPEEVFEALVTEEGRERWLEEPGREIHVESIEPPHRLVWWWSSEDGPATRVDFRIVALPRGARIVVRESAPRFPLAALAARFALVAA